jgi:hypothetical protein
MKGNEELKECAKLWKFQCTLDDVMKEKRKNECANCLRKVRSLNDVHTMLNNI